MARLRSLSGTGTMIAAVLLGILAGAASYAFAGNVGIAFLVTFGVLLAVVALLQWF
jgi:hypothetical protein